MRELSAIGESVGATTPTDHVPVWLDDLQSIPDLKRAVLEAQKTDSTGSVLLAQTLRNIRGQSTPTLLHRLAVVEHPMTAWALHVDLDVRGVPPCLRPWMPEVSRQTAFIATLADLRWLATRHPEHVTKYERLRGVFRYQVHDDRWHKAALWAYRQCRGRRHILASRLALTDAMRRHTLTMPTVRQSNDRRLLGKEVSRIRDTMLRHALTHPDKSGATTPEGLANRRTALLTMFVMLDRNQKDTINCLKLVAGVDISRQTLVRQLHLTATIGDAGRIAFGSV